MLNLYCYLKNILFPYPMFHDLKKPQSLTQYRIILILTLLLKHYFILFQQEDQKGSSKKKAKGGGYKRPK